MLVKATKNSLSLNYSDTGELLRDDSGLPLGDRGFRFSMFVFVGGTSSSLILRLGEALWLGDRLSRRFRGGGLRDEAEEEERRP